MRIGVTGHRPNRLRIGEDRAKAHLHAVLEALRDAARAQGRTEPPIAVSALAEGADRLFAEAALELGFVLEAHLPLRSADYETTFADADTTVAYRSLLARARRVTELPGSLDDTDAAYEAQGRALVDLSDVLIAVWDGRGAAGRGGSPEIISYALGLARPVVWIDAAADRAPLRLAAVGGSLGAAAMAARALTLEDCRAMAAGPARR